MSNHTLIRSMLNMCVKCSTRRRNYSLWFPSNGGSSTHQKAITNAEKLVGYPSSFSSLKYLAEEEPANFLGLAKKLVGSGHPLLLTARDLLSQDSHIGHSLGGLWVLLLSKAVGHNSSNGEILESQLVNGIHLKQRIIADTTELINTAFLIHRSMLDISPNKNTNNNNSNTNNNQTLNLGNKLSVLGGDFLLAKASVELGRIENTEAVEMISKAIGHLSEGAAMEDSMGGLETLKQVEDLSFLLKGSLLSHSCYSAAKVVGHEDVICQQAFQFGRHLSLAQQCAEDIEAFQNNKKILSKRNFVVVYALTNSSKLKQQCQNLFSQTSPSSLDMTRLVKPAIEQFYPDILQQTKLHCNEAYVKKCRENIASFPVQSSVKAINDILSTIHPR